MNKRTVGSSLTARYFPFRGYTVAQMKFSLSADLAKRTGPARDVCCRAQRAKPVAFLRVLFPLNGSQGEEGPAAVKPAPFPDITLP